MIDDSGGWRTLACEPFFRSARLDCALRRLDGVRVRTEGGRRMLAIPFTPGDAFPLPELFCFAHSETVAGRQCVVYAFDRCDVPIL